MNFGYFEDVIEETARVFGDHKTPFIPFNESGDWEQWLPKYEPQSDGFETNGCSVWATQNTIETLHRFLYNSEPNYSERFTYLLTPVDPERGVDPQKVFTCIREDGLVDNAIFPTPHTKEEFLDTEAITGSLLAQGQRWLGNYDLQHEWLWEKRPDNAMELMKDALKTSPLAVTVTAWYRNEEGKYEDREMRNNHFCMVYRIDDEGIHVFDSYNMTKKVLTLDHHIGRAKRIFLNKKTLSGLIRQRNLLQIILDKLMFRKTLLDVIDANIGIDASPNDLAPDELGCAETVTTILKQVYPDTPILVSTAGLYDYLRNPKNGWVLSPVPQIGCVVISPTGMGRKGAHGHTGFCLADDVIVSNSSLPKTLGKFIKNFTVHTWLNYFGALGFPTFYFIRKK